MMGVWGMLFFFLQLMCFRIMGMNQGWPHSTGIVIGSWYFLLFCGCVCLSSQRTNLEAVKEWWTWIPCKDRLWSLRARCWPSSVRKKKGNQQCTRVLPHIPALPFWGPAGCSLQSGQRCNLLVSFSQSGGCADLLPWVWDRSDRLLWRTCICLWIWAHLFGLSGPSSLIIRNCLY